MAKAKSKSKGGIKLSDTQRGMQLAEPAVQSPPSMLTTLPTEEKNQDTSVIQSGSRMQIKPMGASGTELYGGYFSEEQLQFLRGRQGAKTFDEMRRSETQVAMLLNAVMNPIKAGLWEFEAPSEVPDGEKHKNFIAYNAKEMIDWETHLHEALTMLIFGYSVFEIIHMVVHNNPKFGTFMGLKGLAFRSQKTIERWNIDRATGNLQSVEQIVNGDTSPMSSAIIRMDANFVLVFTLQKEGDNYEGISVLRPMYGAWFRKNLYLKIIGIGLEKNAIGTPVGTTPKGTLKQDELDRFEDTLSNFTAHEQAYIMKPEGWTIEVIQNNFDAAKVKEIVIMENTEMINSLVANFLALGTSGGGGSFALGTDLSDFFLSGIQNYANIIAGVWNRKLIPDLIKLNFGPQIAYPKLKATGINDKAGKELAEIVSSLIGNEAIRADMPTEEFLRKQYNLPKADPTTVREKKPAAPFAAPQFTEQMFDSIKLAETYKQQWNGNKDAVKEEMQAGLFTLLESYKKQIKSKYNGATPSQKTQIGLQLEPKGMTAYRDSLRETLAKVANDALISARKLTPKAKNVKLSEHAESIKLALPNAKSGGYFQALPKNIQKIVKAQSDLIAQTQAADLGKIVSFQYTHSNASTDNLDQILKDIDDAALPTIEGSIKNGMSVDAAAGNAVSSVFNQAQLEWFFEPEVLQTIESFTFFNEDPVSEICQELDGTTWAVGDPDLDRYSPPLHHNCKSRLQPNEKGADKNPEIQRGGTPVTQKGLDSITLCEHSYGLEFKLVERI